MEGVEKNTTRFGKEAGVGRNGWHLLVSSRVKYQQDQDQDDPGRSQRQVVAHEAPHARRCLFLISPCVWGATDTEIEKEQVKEKEKWVGMCMSERIVAQKGPCPEGGVGVSPFVQ